tara:strand:+ start:123 stop:1220 length:1098 start_codon:yes stop_codon:yes gene_type:complete
LEKQPKILNIWVGAIFLETQLDKIDSLFKPEHLTNMPQPVRCYFVEYDNNNWRFKFFWSKPSGNGESGNFITNILKESPPSDINRFFNDASNPDPRIWNTALTLTNKEVNFGENFSHSFMYRESFNSWCGLFMGGLSSVSTESVPEEWMNLFIKNAPTLLEDQDLSIAKPPLTPEGIIHNYLNLIFSSQNVPAINDNVNNYKKFISFIRTLSPIEKGIDLGIYARISADIQGLLVDSGTVQYFNKLSAEVNNRVFCHVLHLQETTRIKFKPNLEVIDIVEILINGAVEIKNNEPFNDYNKQTKTFNYNVQEKFTPDMLASIQKENPLYFLALNDLCPEIDVFNGLEYLKQFGIKVVELISDNIFD